MTCGCPHIFLFVFFVMWLVVLLEVCFYLLSAVFFKRFSIISLVHVLCTVLPIKLGRYC